MQPVWQNWNKEQDERKNNMTKKERLLKVFRNEEADKVPVGFWFHLPEDMDLDRECVKAHLDYYHSCDVDMVKIMCDGYFDYPNPQVAHVHSPSDWYQMKPMGRYHPFITGQVNRAKEIVEQLNDEVCTFYNVFCPMSYLRFATSDELLMDHLKEDPEALMYAMDVIAQDAALLSELLITEAGCTGIYYCVQNAEEYRFTTEEYKTYVAPGDLKVLHHANRFSENHILHCCGWAGDKNRVEVWKDYPAKVINWAIFIEDMGLTEGKAFFGNKCVLGGFDNRPNGVLCSGTKEEIEQYTKDLISKVGKKGFIVGADCTLPRTIELERISWVVDAARLC